MWSLIRFILGVPQVKRYTSPPYEAGQYPRITMGEGVWVNEINGHDLSHVTTSPCHHTIMFTEDARTLCGLDPITGE